MKNTIVIWQATTSEFRDAMDSLYGILSMSERERAKRFRVKDKQLEFVTGRGLLRFLLAGMLGTSPEKVEITANPHGKPVCNSAQHHRTVYFNLSHSQEHLLVATTTETEVGIDIEKISSGDQLMEMAKRIFTAEEYEILVSMDHTRRPAAFTNCWTRKEAALKALGTGLVLDSRSFSAGMEADCSSAVVLFPGGTPVSVQSVSICAGYASAVAWCGDGKMAIETRNIKEWLRSGLLESISI